jgi:HEAT repeat protein
MTDASQDDIQSRISNLLSELKSAPNYVCEAIESELAEFGSEAVPFLLLALGKGDGWERSYIVGALGKIKDQRAIATLLGLLPDEDPDVRSSAANALLNMNAADFDLLRQLLHDNRWQLRQIVVYLLGQLKDSRSIPELVAALSDLYPEVRWSAAGALARAAGADAAVLLLNSLQNQDDTMRWVTAMELGGIGNPIAGPQLIFALNDQESDVRALVARALGQLVFKSALPHLLAALQDKEPKVRAEAASALGKLGEDTAFDYLIDLLHDPDSWVRACACEALGLLGNPHAVDLLLPHLNDDVAVRVRAIIALGQLGDERIIPFLEKCPPETPHIHEAIYNIRQRQSGGPIVGQS